MEISETLIISFKWGNISSVLLKLCKLFLERATIKISFFTILIFIQFVFTQSIQLHPILNTKSKKFTFKSSLKSNQFESKIQLNSDNDSEPKSTLLQEIGYISMQQVVFVGMSRLASGGWQYGPYIAGGFDVFMGVAGFQNAQHKETNTQKWGYYLLTLGFIAKSAYNFHYGKNSTSKSQFWVNYFGFNALVYFGYYLDSL